MSDFDPLPFDLDALCEVFRSGEKPASRFKLGVEAEKFGLTKDGLPLPYYGAEGVEGLFDRLLRRGWEAYKETEGGPTIALTKGAASVTLEPAAQVELSGAPARDVHVLRVELLEHLSELGEVCAECGLYWLHLGFHPSATHDELPWVPKQRYPVMKDYLPTKGARALDMMRRTATVQVNLDYEDEADAMLKLVTLLRVTPFLQALTLNAPFIEGRVSPLKSERLDVWLNMDPARSGLIRRLWETNAPSYRDYAAWALEAGMFLLRRPQGLVLNTGQSFADFLKHGFDGERATLEDWKLHLGSLFPEVRMKTTLEVRGVDALPPRLSLSVPAFLAGLVYDATALETARGLLEDLDYDTAVELQRRVATHGLGAEFNGIDVRSKAVKLLGAASAGLARRAARGDAEASESEFLAPLEDLAERGRVPADDAVDAFAASGLTELADFLPDWARRVSMPE